MEDYRGWLGISPPPFPLFNEKMQGGELSIPLLSPYAFLWGIL